MKKEDIDRIIQEQLETNEGILGLAQGIGGVGKKLGQKFTDMTKSISSPIVNKTKEVAQRVVDFSKQQYYDLENSFKEAKKKGDEKELKTKINIADAIIKQQISLLVSTVNKVNQYRRDLGEQPKKIEQYIYGKDTEI